MELDACHLRRFREFVSGVPTIRYFEEVRDTLVTVGAVELEAMRYRFDDSSNNRKVKGLSLEEIRRIPQFPLQFNETGRSYGYDLVSVA